MAARPRPSRRSPPKAPKKDWKPGRGERAEKQGVALPKTCRTDFEACRDILNKWSNHRIEDEEIDFGLEKVSTLIDSLSKSREKENVLDFQIEDNNREFLEKHEEIRLEGDWTSEIQETRELFRERGLGI